jgi:hypothetical protein
MKALQSIVLLVATHLATWHHISQDLNLKQHQRENLKSVILECSCDLWQVCHFAADVTEAK